MEKRKRQMNLLYIPAVLLMACFVLYPLARGVYISFFKWNGYSQNMTFIGLKNYLNLFADKYFKSSFWNTMLYGFGSALLQNVFGLALALPQQQIQDPQRGTDDHLSTGHDLRPSDGLHHVFLLPAQPRRHQ